MANFASIARPYALAAFEYARDSQQLSEWKAFLDAASTMAKESVVDKLLNNPELSSAKLFDLFHDVLSSLLDEKRKNFLLLLAENDRLPALPEIAEQFATYYAALEKISQVRVVTAIATQEEFRQKLIAALTKRIKHQVTLHCEVDPAILGGAIIHMGDNVIDGSIRGKLTRLLEFSLR